MEENNVENELKQIHKEKNKIGSTILIIVCVLLVILIAIFLAFSWVNMNNTNIIPGISIQGIDVSGLSKEQAEQKVRSMLQEKMPETILLEYGEVTTQLNVELLDVKFDIVAAVNKAYSIGRNGNVVQNNWTVLKTIFQNCNIEPLLLLNDQELEKQLQDISAKLPDMMIQSSYYIEETNLILTKGQKGKVVDIVKTKQEIEQEIRKLEKIEKKVILAVKEQSPEDINLQAIYEQIHKDPINAYYTTNPFVIHPHENGVDFAISMEEAKQIIAGEAEEYTIPLKITKPPVTTSMIGTEAFPDLLSSFSTNYNTSNKDRTTNLKLASNKINGTVIMPGETFSYNTIVGKRTIAAGYKEAPIYQNGQVVDGLGGGICQISSTLYNAVVYADLQIIERRNHMFVPSYVKASRDATVVYGSTDFKFKNNRNYPIKILCSVGGGSVNFQIFGLKQENDCQIEIQTKITGSIPYATQYVSGSGKKAGTVLQKGAKGTKSEAYKVKRRNGQVVGTELLSKDTYKAMNKLIAQ